MNDNRDIISDLYETYEDLEGVAMDVGEILKHAKWYVNYVECRAQTHGGNISSIPPSRKKVMIDYLQKAQQKLSECRVYIKGLADSNLSTAIFQLQQVERALKQEENPDG